MMIKQQQQQTEYGIETKNENCLNCSTYAKIAQQQHQKICDNLLVRQKSS